jgi:hypothetical protein
MIRVQLIVSISSGPGRIFSRAALHFHESCYKGTNIFEILQAFQLSDSSCFKFFRVISNCFIFCQIICAFSCISHRFFVPLHHQTSSTKNSTIMQQSPNTNSGFEGDHKVQSSKLKVQSLGRTELAARYFPFIQPKSAWEKLRSLLQEDPGLAHLTKLKRRTFLPAEVNIIYQHLGQP